MKQRTFRVVATVFLSMMALSGAAQYFGIGTATPQATLDLEGTGANHLIRLRESSGSPTVRLALNSVFAGMPYVGTDNPTGFGIVANNLQLITASKNGNVGINTLIPHASAIMELESNNRGLLVPRMSSAQRTAIANPATGLLVFDTDVNGFYFFNGAAWATVTIKSELERITEGGKTGHRILNRLAANYGDIGQDAIDLSFSSAPSSTLGATGNLSFAAGQLTTASGAASTAMGYGSSATGLVATAIGNLCIASGNYAVAIGASNISSGTAATALGLNDSAIGNASFVAGSGAVARGSAAVSLGTFTKANGNFSFAAVRQAEALGISSVAMGQQSVAVGNHAIALSIGDTASGTASFAAGYYSKASGEYSVAIGNAVEATGTHSLALGRITSATGIGATAMGQNTEASGNSATALGQNTLATATASTAMGNATIAKSYGELAIGAFNDTLLVANGTVLRSDSNRILTVGNGLTATNRRTAFVIQQDGRVGIGVRRPSSLLQVNGEVGINGTYPLELGADVAGKELNAGKIGYEAFTLGALDVVGAGTAAANRRIKLWAEGGLDVAGTLVQEAVQLPTLLNGWQNYGVGFAPIGYWKDKEGMVHLRGFVSSGNTTSSTVLFNLPAAYRPSGGRLVFAVLSNNGIGRVDINTTGDVFIDNVPGNGWLNLTGIAFRTN